MSLELPISHSAEIECPKCNNTSNQNFEIHDLEFESSYERGMGAENEYSFTAEVTCPVCKKDIEINGEVWEYPEGDVNLIQMK
jgi:C4-type Zn-finger protein